MKIVLADGLEIRAEPFTYEGQSCVRLIVGKPGYHLVEGRMDGPTTLALSAFLEATARTMLKESR